MYSWVTVPPAARSGARKDRNCVIMNSRYIKLPVLICFRVDPGQTGPDEMAGCGVGGHNYPG